MRKIPKIVAYILLGILGLIILIFIVLQVPATQKYIANKVSETFSTDLKTHVSTDRVKVGPFGSISMDNLIIIDLEGDTLLRADEVAGNLHYWKMVSSKIYLTNLRLKDAIVNIKRDKGEKNFNYQFLLDYFIPPADTTTTSKTWYFDLGSAKVNNLALNYRDAITGTVLYGNSGEAFINFITLGLEDAHMEIDEVNIRNGNFRMVQYAPSPLDTIDTTATDDQPVAAVEPQRFSVNYLGFENIEVQYDDMQVDPMSSGIDFSHLDITRLHADIENIYIAGTDIAANIQNIGLREKSGLRINRFTTDLIITDREIALRNLLIQTPGTTLRNHFAMKYDSFEEFNNFADEVIMHARFNDSKITMADVKLFVPGLDTIAYLNQNRIEEVYLSGNFDGKLTKFIAEDLAIKINDRNLIRGNITANNLMDPDNIFISVDIDRLLLQPNLIKPFINSPKIPNDIWTFDQIKFDGQFILLPNSLMAQNAALALDDNIVRGDGTISNLSNIENGNLNIHLEQLIANRKAINLVKSFGVELPGDLNSVSRAVASGDLRGSLDDLYVNNFSVSLDNQHIFRGSAHLRNIQNFDNAFVDANINTLQTNSEMIASLIPDQQLPDNFHELGTITYSGRVYGTTRDLTAKGALTSDVGKLTPNLNINIPEEKYKGSISTENFDLRFLMSDTLGLGRITFEANVEGQGFDLENMTATGTANIALLEFNNYEYRNISIDGNIDDQVLSGELNIDDPNLQLVFDGTISLTEELPVYSFQAQLAQANFQRLNLTSDPYQLSANLDFDFSGNSMENITGRGVITEFELEGSETVYMDTILLTSTIENDTQTIALVSDIMDFRMVGDYNIAEVPGAVTAVINNYLYDEPLVAAEAEQFFQYRLNVKRQTSIPGLFIPGFENLGTGRLTGNFNSTDRTLTAEGGFHELIFSAIEVYDFGISAQTDADAINYSITTSHVSVLDSFVFPNARIMGTVADQNIGFNLRVFSDTAVDRLNLAGNLDMSGVYQRLTLDPSTVVFNDQNWNIPSGNELIFGDQHFEANNFVLQNGEQRIGINSDANSDDLILDIENLKIHDLTNIAIYHGYDFSGVANGDVIINNVFGEQGIDVDATVSQFSINNDTIGELRIQYDKPANNTVANVNLVVFQTRQRARIAGTVTTGENATNLNLTANLDRFRLLLLEPFLTDIFSEMAGFASGNLNIGGTMESPALDGSIALEDAAVTPVLNQTRYSIQNTTIALNNSRINLNDVVLVDPQDNRLNVNGVVRHDFYQNFVLDLTATTDHFQFLNTSAKDNEFFYGQVFASGNIRITGEMTDPDIYVDATTGEGTSVYLPTVQGNQVMAYDFINFRPIEDEELEMRGPRVGFDVEMNLEVEPNALVTVVINPLTGEQLTSRGRGSLYLTTNELGDMNIFGTFEVEEGEYTFALEREGLTRKRLSITPGSTLTWRGDPEDATINATAVYDVRTNVQPLVPGAQDAAYRKRVPINVLVNLQGELFAPDITFDLELDTENVEVFDNAVAQVIQQVKADQNELNKQVFGLLIFEQFLPPSLVDVNLGGEGDFLYNTIGGFVSNQFSKLASDKLGVNVDVSFEQYDVTGTDNSISTTSSVNVALSKAFLNDRLEVIIGSSYYTGNEDIQGADNSFFGYGDIIIRYDVTPRGNLKVKVFNRNDFDIFREQIQNRIGGGASYSIDFDTLFGRKEDEVAPTREEIQELEKEERQEEVIKK